MSKINAVVVYYDVVTSYGWGVDSCWRGILSGETAISRLSRFSTESFQTKNAAVVPDLVSSRHESLVMQMISPLVVKAIVNIPADAFLILATTVGEIDILEQYVLGSGLDAADSRLVCLLDKVKRLSGVNNSGMICSAACASSSSAIARAMAMIRQGERDCVLVAACDSVNEFVFAGFSSLMAFDEYMARPFDRNRKGLSLGEGAGLILLMSKERALLEKRPVLGEVAGWGLTGDANHMTGSSRDGKALALAVRRALKSAGVSSEMIGCVSAHGTGTVYNDSMEMKAFKEVFQKRKVPVYSVKGGTGHTMGMAGLLEAIIALESLKEGVIPPTVNTRGIDKEAQGWVSSQACSFDTGLTLSTNSGFGGVNSALVLRR